MLTLMLVLTGVQVFLELKLCHPSGNWVQRTFHHWNRRSPFFGLALSVVLSIAVSMAFGAGGMIVLGSGLLSTMITQVYYSLPEQSYQDLLKRKAELHDWFITGRDRWYRNTVICLRMIRLIFLVILLPFRMFFWAVDKFNAAATRVGKLRI